MKAACRYKKILNRLPTALALVLFAGAMEVVGRYDLSLFLPRFSTVLRTLWNLVMAGPLWEAILRSLDSFVMGVTSAAVGGILAGLVLGRYPLIAAVFDPFIGFMMSAPLPTLVPVLIVLFGVGRVVVLLTVFLFAFFIILVNTRAGVEGTRQSLVDMARSYGASEVQLLGKVYLPSALPSIATGLRLGVINGFKGLIIAEMMLGLGGLGRLLAQYANVYLISHLYAVVLTVMGMALLGAYVVQALDGLFIRWK
jgi:NitT/TauT family transport system permease protein